MANHRKHLTPLRTLLERKREELKAPWNTIEQDYVLSWVLWGLAQIPELANSLVFKGGTCLKKVYFRDYRFSEDLDFSCLSNAPSGSELGTLLQLALDSARAEMSKTIPNPVLELKRYTESKEHPENQEAFVVKAQLPWHRSPFVRVMIEITRNEALVDHPKKSEILSDYDNIPSALLLSYSLEEVAAEKMRAILQNIIKLHERGWTRSRARDFYDLWNIFQLTDYELKKEKVIESLAEKCELKAVSYKSSEDFFDEKILTLVRKDWQQWLQPLVKELPDVDLVLKDLRVFFFKLLSK